MLKIIYGKSGTGKSSKLYNDIKENLSSEKIFLIVPEQSNLKAEQNLIEYLGVSSLMNVQVLTLSRMAFRILEEVGRINLPTLSASGKAMIIYDILKSEEKNLKFLGKSDKNIDIVINLLTELKKNNITEKDLEETKVQDTYTNLKLDDVKLIYKKYNERIAGKFIDENDILNVISEKIKSAKMFENALIYIDDFLGFTPQEYKVFEELLKKVEKITVAISADNLQKGKKELDVFYFNKVFANRLIDIAKENHQKIEIDECSENLRLENDELKFLEQAFSSQNFKTYKEENSAIKLFLANNSYSEVEYIANEILKLVKGQGYKYNEIAVITNNLEEYSLDGKIVFDKYDIPIFIDEKKDLNQNILIRYVLAVLDVFAKNWSYDAMFNYLKTGLIEIPEEDLFILENYCKQWGIKYNKWFKEFSYEEKNDKQDKLEELRKQIVQPLLNLKENILKNKTAKEITRCIYDFLIENNINEILDNKIKNIGSVEINNEYNTSYKILVSVLDTIVDVFGEEEISFEKYRDLLQVGFSTSELGKIPASQDEVIFGDAKRSRNSNIKVVFICGVNDGYFPLANKFEGFLNDQDRILLEETGLEMAKTSIELLYESNFEIYNILSLASQKLYLSYVSSDKEGKSIRPSILIKKLKRIFPNLKEESDIISKDFYVTNIKATFDDAILVYRDYLEGKEITDEWKTVINYFEKFYKDKFEKVLEAENYTNKSETISDENIQKLYGNNLKTSVSKLEQYRRCPFAFHLKYGLKLEQNPELKIQSIDTGNFMHQIIDEFFGYIDSKNLNVKELTEEDVQEIVQKIIDDTLELSKYYILQSTAKFRTLTKKLKKVTADSINYIVYTIQNSSFECLGHEIEFSEDGRYKPINIELENGKKLEIIGKIDRVDIGKLNDKTYVRIIDYKSSVKDVDMAQVEAGLQIQLVTYLDSISKQEDFDPSGILYFGMVDNIYPSNKNVDDETIKEGIKKQFRMKGYVLADIDVVRMMDNKLTTGSSDIIPVNITKKEVFHKQSKVISEEEFEKLENRVEEVVKQIGDEIMSGKIDIKPYKYKRVTGCNFCEYKSICNFNPNLKDNTYNKIQVMSK